MHLEIILINFNKKYYLHILIWYDNICIKYMKTRKKKRGMKADENKHGQKSCGCKREREREREALLGATYSTNMFIGNGKHTGERGITLIAVIITVIVMLILAMVTISSLNNGIIDKTKQAVEIYNNSESNDESLTGELQGMLDNALKGVNTGNEESPTYIGGQYNAAKGVNTPRLADGLIPVTINADGAPSIVANPDTDDWYSYTTSDKRWANAITENDNGDITGYWVWIPRYAYQITSQYHTGGTGAGNINIKFLKNKTDEAADGTTTWDNSIGVNHWNIHPAFTSNVNMGGWDEELAGIWVAKFPAGYAGGNNTVPVVSTGINYSGETADSNFYGLVNTSTPMNYPVFLPETYAYNYINVGDSFNLAQNLGKSGNIYGLKANSNSHQMKNSEWGAVAYLTQSNYGLNGNIYMNDVIINFIPPTVSNITGWVCDGPNSPGNIVTIEDLNNRTQSGENIWYSSTGQKGSSTGNIYGIYDLSGCVWELISSYIENPAGEDTRAAYGGNMMGGASNKLKTVYSYNETDILADNYEANNTMYGDAMYETSSNGTFASPYSWYDDCNNFVWGECPYFGRGANMLGGGSYGWTGVFCFGYSYGSADYSIGFRAVLCPL